MTPVTPATLAPLLPVAEITFKMFVSVIKKLHTGMYSAVDRKWFIISLTTQRTVLE